MLKRCLHISTIVVLLALAIGCATSLPSPSPQHEAEPKPVRAILSLDWVPNTNHTGFYVAQEKGWYVEEGIDLEIQIPSDPAAALKQVAYGNTEFGVSFQEEVTMARSNDIPVVSLAAIIQHNTSAFASLAETGIQSARDIEGKRYASYGLPIERPILGQLMACDGGDINKVEFIDVGFDAFPALIGKRADLAWIFMAWDGVQADIMGVRLNVLPLYGSCVPDYYTPVVVAGEATIANKPDLVRRFMAATTRGYEYAIAHPEESAEILLRASPETDTELARRSQAWLSPRYQDDAPRWGVQKLEVWQEFADFMFQNQLIAKPVEPQKAF
ncbi:MAG: ABC transporter substrate-binding protein, partial [Chloroflexi bacterium]|nr:ABC transporter substrate-binding protein [Chloroflexota bacterium]